MNSRSKLTRRGFTAAAGAVIAAPACAQIPLDKPSPIQKPVLRRRPVNSPPSITPAETSVTVFVDQFGIEGANEYTSAAAFDAAHAGKDIHQEAQSVVNSYFTNGGRKAIAVNTNAENPSATIADIRASVKPDLEFDFICVPAAARMPAADANAIYAEALAVARAHKAILLMDAPLAGGDIINDWLNTIGIFDRDAAMFAPRLSTAGISESVAASGAVAGVAARTDASRGIWKAPAGVEASIIGAAPDVNYAPTEIEQLAGANINTIRSIPGRGTLVWGARTVSSDPEWKYIPVRRTALFIEKSVGDGLSWTVFEPNAEPLWTTVRQSIETFMQDLFRQGAFQGASANEAYFVKCDRTTTTQADIDNGRLNVLIGFAPLRPAEFVILRIEAKAGLTP